MSDGSQWQMAFLAIPHDTESPDESAFSLANRIGVRNFLSWLRVKGHLLKGVAHHIRKRLPGPKEVLSSACLEFSRKMSCSCERIGQQVPLSHVQVALYGAHVAGPAPVRVRKEANSRVTIRIWRIYKYMI